MRADEFARSPQKLFIRSITNEDDLIESAKTLQAELQTVTGKWDKSISYRSLCSGHWNRYHRKIHESVRDTLAAGKQFIENFVRLDEFDNLTIKVGAKVAILNLVLSQDSAELWGFTAPKTITKIERDQDSSHIVKFEFNGDPTDIWPRHDIVSFNGELFDHCAFFGSKQSAEHAVTTMALVAPSGFNLRTHVQGSTNESVVNEYENGTENSKQIFDQLKQAGYTKLGAGQDATVWAKDEGSVIKILMPTDKPHQAENGFLTFYNFCQQHTDLPNLPKFVTIGGAHHSTFDINGTQYRQIAMERLQPIVNKSFEEAMVWMLSDLANSRARWEHVTAKLLDADEWWSDGNGMQGMPSKIKEKMATDPSFNATYGLLLATMQMLYLVGKQAGLGWDLHTENVMQRRDGTLVIVDPFYS